MKILWTDGSAIPNPGRGGWAVIEQQSDGTGRPVKWGCGANTTNIRMEAQAIIAAIKYAGEEGCEIHTDSQFWVKVLTEWADGWRARGWKKRSGAIENLDLVKKLYELYHQYPVKMVWVRGHVGTKLNEMADEWADKARNKGESVI
ncbi:ribonuclease HI [Candidatus Saccharibacteria bacterium]|nr:ribonuclease HI [Candidatus Saccharibacteria bacterium]